jgi:two-component SAPR family response regulator
MNGLRVLLVEDESLVAMAMEDMLTDMNCRVIGCFAALNPAITWLGRQPDAPDVALLDVNLGGEMVFPLAELLQARQVPFAFVTGYGALPEVGFASAEIIHKPVERGKLDTVLRSLASARA